MVSTADVLDAVLVSPEEWIRESYRARLELDGYHVRVAEDAVGAFREIRREAPDLVFVDRDSDGGLVELLVHLLARAGVAPGFPILCIERRSRSTAGADGQETALTYAELDGWWPVEAGVLRVLGVLEAG